MEILLDSADPIEIREVAGRGLICGITTNPSVYAKAARGVPFVDRLRELIEASPGHVFTQVIGIHDTESMVRQTRWLARQSDSIVVKLPMTQEGLAAVTVLKREDPSIKLAVTGVASVAQALLAGVAGADVVALFNGPLDQVSDTPVEIVGSVKQMYAHSGIETKVLSCGRFPRGVGGYAASGTDMITLRKEYLDLLYEHPYTDKRLNGFMSDWDGAFGSETWPQA
jgi:transaldolase